MKTIPSSPLRLSVASAATLFALAFLGGNASAEEVSSSAPAAASETPAPAAPPPEVPAAAPAPQSQPTPTPAVVPASEGAAAPDEGSHDKGSGSSPPATTDVDTGSALPPAAAPAPTDAEGPPASGAVVDGPGPEEGGTGAAPVDAPPRETSPREEMPEGITTDVGQSADVVNNGTAVGNSGANVAVGNASSSAGTTGQGTGVNGSTAPSSGPSMTSGSSNTSTGTGTVGTGSSGAVGNQDRSSIQQGIVAVVTEDGRIEILQVALIVNIGIGWANSGDNVGIGNLASNTIFTGPGGGGGGTSVGLNGANGVVGIGSGNATVVGNTGSTTITQLAAILGGDRSIQLGRVLNVGLGIGNSGANVGIGNVAGSLIYTAQGGLGVRGADSASTNMSTGIGTVASGRADALGNRSTSSIIQMIMANAADSGRLSLAQRAVIVNFGLGFANSGLNAAIGNASANTIALQQESMARSLVMALLSSFGGPGAPASMGLTSGGLSSGGAGTGGTATAANTATGSAVVLSGGASAVGNDTLSGILQDLRGAVSGNAIAMGSQEAAIGNFGAAIANTGVNVAFGNLASSSIAMGQLTQASASIQSFLALLANPGGAFDEQSDDFSSSVDLGSALLEVFGDISATEMLLGIDEGEADVADAAGIVVRQVTGVLNIGIALSNSGDNTAAGDLSVNTNDTTQESGDSVVSGTLTLNDGRTVNLADGRVTLDTGQVFVIGNEVDNRICQTNNVADGCKAPVEETPGAGGAGGGAGAPETPGPDVAPPGPEVPSAPEAGPAVLPAAETPVAMPTEEVPGDAAPVVLAVAVADATPAPLPAPGSSMSQSDDERVASVGAASGSSLPLTGGPLALEALVGIGLLASGGLLRRRRRP